MLKKLHPIQFVRGPVEGGKPITCAYMRLEQARLWWHPSVVPMWESVYKFRQKHAVHADLQSRRAARRGHDIFSIARRTSPSWERVPFKSGLAIRYQQRQ